MGHTWRLRWQWARLTRRGRVRCRVDGALPDERRAAIRSHQPAVAARIRQLAAQAQHRRAIAESHARRAADQQARLDALLLEAIAALASLFSEPG
jgi:hypothetical protein